MNRQLATLAAALVLVNGLAIASPAAAGAKPGKRAATCSTTLSGTSTSTFGTSESPGVIAGRDAAALLHPAGTTVQVDRTGLAEGPGGPGTSVPVYRIVADTSLTIEAFGVTYAFGEAGSPWEGGAWVLADGIDASRAFERCAKHLPRG